MIVPTHCCVQITVYIFFKIAQKLMTKCFGLYTNSGILKPLPLAEISLEFHNYGFKSYTVLFCRGVILQHKQEANVVLE